MLQWINDTEYASWVRESWGWPFALTIHAFGNAVIVGLMFIICLRLFGLFRTIPYTSLPKLIPYMWVGFVAQVYSGFTLWATKPQKYMEAFTFDVKFTSLLVGAVLLFYFQRTLVTEAAGWQASGKVSERGMRLGILAAVAWACVLMFGRLTAYLGSLYGG